MEEHRSLGQVERRLANERLRSLEPRERVAISRAAEMKCVLDAFIRVHKAAGATPAQGGI
ncbi:unnamed protein product, partial [Pylaiella littoralis]